MPINDLEEEAARLPWQYRNQRRLRRLVMCRLRMNRIAESVLFHKRLGNRFKEPKSYFLFLGSCISNNLDVCFPLCGNNIQ